MHMWSGGSEYIQRKVQDNLISLVKVIAIYKSWRAIIKKHKIEHCHCLNIGISVQLNLGRSVEETIPFHHMSS